MQLNFNFFLNNQRKCIFLKNIFVAQRKWWNGGNPPYEKLIKVGTGPQHLSIFRMTCGNNAQCLKSKAKR